MKKPFTITLAEEKALMQGVLRHYASEMQQRIHARYPEALQDIQEQDLEDKVFRSIVRMHAYGFYKIEHLEELAEQDIFSGKEFEKDNPLLLDICQSDRSEDEKMSEIMSLIFQ